MSINFGMLQKIKQADLQKNPKLQNLQTEFKSQADIFTQAKQAYEKAEMNGDQENGGGVQSQTFAQPTMSVDELKSQMDEAMEKLEKLQATLMKEVGNNKGDPKAPEGEDKDDKNKVPPKGFSGMMA